MTLNGAALAWRILMRHEGWGMEVIIYLISWFDGRDFPIQIPPVQICCFFVYLKGFLGFLIKMSIMCS
jgi:hypothetical protein